MSGKSRYNRRAASPGAAYVDRSRHQMRSTLSEQFHGREITVQTGTGGTTIVQVRSTPLRFISVFVPIYVYLGALPSSLTSSLPPSRDSSISLT
jgi:hypothetical protein